MISKTTPFAWLLLAALCLHSLLAVAGTCPVCKKSDIECTCNSDEHMQSWNSYTAEAQAGLASLQNQMSSLASYSGSAESQAPADSESLLSHMETSPYAPGFVAGLTSSGSQQMVPYISGQTWQVSASRQTTGQSLVTQDDFKRWRSMTETLSDLNQSLLETLKNNRKNQERLKQIKLIAKLLIEQGVEQPQAYEQANQQVGDEHLIGSAENAQHINESIMVQIAAVLEMSSLASQHHNIIPGLDISTLTTGTAAQHITTLLDALQHQTNPNMHLIVSNLKTIMNLLDQAAHGGLNPVSVYQAKIQNPHSLTEHEALQAVFSASHPQSTPVLFDAVVDMAQSIQQHFDQLPASPTLTIVGLGGTLSPLNGNNIMVIRIPQGSQVVTILISPLLGVMVTESTNSQAVAEYLYRYLGLLVTTQVTDSVVIASATSGHSHSFMGSVAHACFQVLNGWGLVVATQVTGPVHIASETSDHCHSLMGSTADDCLRYVSYMRRLMGGSSDPAEKEKRQREKDD